MSGSDPWERINRQCRGYSGAGHWRAFERILAEPGIRTIGVLGVYHGRDIAYMASILRALGRRDYEIIGVDRFEDSACADWPAELRGLSWEEAGFGPPPSLEAARENLAALGLADGVALVRAPAEDFLVRTDRIFDLLYLDTSHDYETTVRQLELAAPRMAREGWLAGDDFSDRGTWGVASAVRDSFRHFETFYDWIWRARSRDLRPRRAPSPRSRASAA